MHDEVENAHAKPELTIYFSPFVSPGENATALQRVLTVSCLGLKGRVECGLLKSSNTSMPFVSIPGVKRELKRGNNADACQPIELAKIRQHLGVCHHWALTRAARTRNRVPGSPTYDHPSLSLWLQGGVKQKIDITRSSDLLAAGARFLPCISSCASEK